MRGQEGEVRGGRREKRGCEEGEEGRDEGEGRKKGGREKRKNFASEARAAPRGRMETRGREGERPTHCPPPQI